MQILFLCTTNLHRSKTAEALFQAKDRRNLYRSAGLNAHLCAKFGTTLCTEALLTWADLVFVMEPRHRERIRKYTQGRFLEKIYVLGLEDRFQYMEMSLQERLLHTLEPYFEEEEEGFVWERAAARNRGCAAK